MMAAIVEIAKAHPTDGTRMVAAIASRQLGEPVNRKRAQRIMRTHRPSAADAWSGATSPTRILPGETAGRVVAYGHDQSLDSPSTAGFYLHAIVDCCTRDSSHGVSTCGAEPSRRWLVSTRR